MSFLLFKEHFPQLIWAKNPRKAFCKKADVTTVQTKAFANIYDLFIDTQWKLSILPKKKKNHRNLNNEAYFFSDMHIR